VYAGHAAVALALQTRRPRLPIALLVAVCFGPDWVELALALAVGRGAGEAYSHCIPAVLACAAAVGALYTLRGGRLDAAWLALGWLLHWPADFLTAHKPLLRPDHVVGLDLYMLPGVDFTIEAVLVTLGCLVYARAFASTPPQRRWVLAMGLALVVLQAVLDFGLAHQPGRVWTPTL
jgi:hypothetical protein